MYSSPPSDVAKFSNKLPVITKSCDNSKAGKEISERIFNSDLENFRFQDSDSIHSNFLQNHELVINGIPFQKRWSLEDLVRICSQATLDFLNLFPWIGTRINTKFQAKFDIGYEWCFQLISLGFDLRWPKCMSQLVAIWIWNQNVFSSSWFYENKNILDQKFYLKNYKPQVPIINNLVFWNFLKKRTSTQKRTETIILVLKIRTVWIAFKSWTNVNSIPCSVAQLV
jgi:hypothetical protein